jgi:hypothetical protein
LTSYHHALAILEKENFPELQFKISIDIARVCLAKNHLPVARQFQSQAIEIIENIFKDRSANQHRIGIVLTQDKFYQLDEDLEICLHFQYRQI